MGRPAIDMLGMEFPNFTVKGRVAQTKLGLIEWECLCVCGKIFIKSSGSIKKNPSTCCGCKKKRQTKTAYVGEIFERLTVMSEPFLKDGHYHVCCSCTCGVSKIISVQSLFTGATTSCGCYHRGRVSKHGESKTQYYKTYHAMLGRCFNPENDAYEFYGGRGITVCEEWSNKESGYESFKEYMGECPENMSLERIDVNGDYCPENCKWETRSVQTINRRRTRVNSSGRTGVFWSKAKKRWFVTLTKDGKSHWYGQYKDFEDACMAVNSAEISLFGFSREGSQ